MAHNNRDPDVLASEYIQALASAVRAEAAAQRVSLAELARRCEVEKSTFMRYANGKREWKLSVLWRVAYELGMPLEQLTGLAEERMPTDK